MKPFKNSISLLFSTSLIITPALGSQVEMKVNDEEEDPMPLSQPVLRRTIGTHKYIIELNEFMETHNLTETDNAKSYESTLHYFFSCGLKNPTLEDVKTYTALAKKPDEQTELFESILKRERDL